MTAVQLDRTAPFDLIPKTPISRVSDTLAQVITHKVTIPGLTQPGGGLVQVDVTYTLQEIEHDYVAVIVDHAYDTDLRYFGNHPLAEGPLRQLLPASYPLPAPPKVKRQARDAIRRLIGHHDLGGWIAESDLRESHAIYLTPPRALWDDQAALDRYFAIVNEYVPFHAEVAWSKWDGVAAIRIRPHGERI